MTVHEINSGNSGPSEPETEDSPDVKKVVVQQENSSNHHIQRTSCFFEWRLLPQHKIEDGESQEDNVQKNSTFCKFKCDLCLGMCSCIEYSLFRNSRFYVYIEQDISVKLIIYFFRNCGRWHSWIEITSNWSPYQSVLLICVR